MCWFLSVMARLHALVHSLAYVFSCRKHAAILRWFHLAWKQGSEYTSMPESAAASQRRPLRHVCATERSVWTVLLHCPVRTLLAMPK